VSPSGTLCLDRLCLGNDSGTTNASVPVCTTTPAVSLPDPLLQLLHLGGLGPQTHLSELCLTTAVREISLELLVPCTHPLKLVIGMALTVCDILLQLLNPQRVSMFHYCDVLL
jgi:hypothetical protein